jgi:hypothetical protein
LVFRGYDYKLGITDFLVFSGFIRNAIENIKFFNMLKEALIKEKVDLKVGSL